MTASDVESMTIAELLAMASDKDRAAFDALHLGYSETYGLPALRDEIARTYERMSPANILCFAGAQEGIFAAMHALLEPGDHAIVVTPNYQSAETIPLSICSTTGVPLDAERGWALDLDRIAAAIRPETKLISINFPHNPTGAMISEDTLRGLVGLCRKQGIWLFSDEVYRGLSGTGNSPVVQAADIYERALSLNVMSKAYGLPGLRIGWIACADAAVLGRMERLKHYLSICNPVPSEHLALIALKVRTQILARNNALLEANVAALSAFFAEFGELFDWQPPAGGCVGFPRYRGADGVEALCARLVEEAGVLLLPSSLYVSDLNEVPQDRFRIGFGRKGMDEGLAAMRAFLNRNR
jgi:aspartate/methionine/tyrosine aminotransferase